MNISNPASVVKDPFRKSGFPGIDVGRNSDVSLKYQALQVAVRQEMCW